VIRGNIIAILFVMILGFVVILSLYVFSSELTPERHDFLRNYRMRVLRRESVLNLDNGYYHIAGMTKHGVFLHDSSSPQDVVIVNFELKVISRVHLSITGTDSLKRKWNCRMDVDSPFFYLKSGSLPMVLKGRLGDWNAVRIMNNVPFFEQGVFGDGDHFLFQSVVTRTDGREPVNIIGMMLPNVAAPKVSSVLLEDQNDNFLTTAGILRYSKKMNSLVYIYGYRNQYIVLDENLNLLHRGNTIDDVRREMINPVETKRDSYTLASPPAVVNASARIYDQILFVHSNVMSSNEDVEHFNQASVVDLYDMNSNRYLFSFYLPDYDGVKMIDFSVADNLITASYGRYVVSYIFDDSNYRSLVFSKNGFVK